MGHFHFIQKYLFLLLSFQFCIIYGTFSQKLSPQLQKSFYYETYFVFKTMSSIIVIR